MKKRRHKWGKASAYYSPNNQVCEHCGTVRVLKSGNGFEWTEYYDARGRLHQGKKQPECA